MVAGAAFVLLWLYHATGGGAYVIQIDYTWGGEMLDGAEVMVDDSVVGTLAPHEAGQRVVGFEVEPGTHTVMVQGNGCEGIAREVKLSPGEARRAVLMADIDDGYRCRIRLW
jgi:hypothetical protein